MNDKQSFWMHYGSNVRLYSNLMMPLSDEKKLNARIHLQANTFLSVWAETDNLLYVPTYYGTILTVDGDTLKKKIYLVTNPSGYTVGSLADGRFLLVAGKNNFYYAQAFSKNGVKEKDSICIHSATNGSKRNPSFALNGTAICFAWSEVRSPSPGYSIYSSVMDLSTLVDVKGTPGVGVPKQNQLFQNYPNPFNPATVIKFQTSEVGKTTLRIFDVLGREVAVLLNEEQSPGIKQVEWNASGIASGIYFYKMEVYGKKNLYVESKKMLLLK